MKKVSLLLFAIIGLLEFYGEFTYNSELMFFTKPLVLPMMMVYYTISVKEWNAVHRLMMAALFFSWTGDISLMLTPNSSSDLEIMGITKNKNLFLCGIASFLITQVLFICVFLKTKIAGNNNTKNIDWKYYVPFAAYWAAMLYIVVPALIANPENSKATIPVIIYSGILVSMAATALSRYGFASRKSFLMVFIGSVIFVVSDSLIAINFLVFETPMKYAGFLIFTTYLIAEYLIAEGILNDDNM